MCRSSTPAVRRVVYALCSFTLLSVTAQPPPTPPQLILKYETKAQVFGVWELSVSLPKEMTAFATLPDTQIHDAYDADRDGVFLTLAAEFAREGGPRIVVPGFALKEEPQGPWQWRIRWSPTREGRWTAKVLFSGRATPAGRMVTVGQEVPEYLPAKTAAGISGYLVAPGKQDHPGYLRRLRADGTTEALWLFGACRAWVARSQDPNNDWQPDECLDRETELLAPMREGGFNLLNQWMAPWEFLLVHHDRAEYWQQPDDEWQRVPLAPGKAWSSYQCYDQGRCLAFDRLVTLAEGDAQNDTIHLLLSPLPHQCLQVREHPWGGQESGWSPENDAGRQTAERLNGLSGFKRNMAVWEFFDATPSAPLDDWRSRLFDHQANFFRYVIARWGYSRAVGVWVLVDELDAVGDEVGSMSAKKGWWGHEQGDRWLADIVRMFRGGLSRADGLRYQGDPFGHPLHAATTSYAGQAGKGGNLEWQGGPHDARPDLLGWHWYPSWSQNRSWDDIWEYTIDGVARYAQAPIGNQARLISEFGAPDRKRPDAVPSPLYPSLFHFAAWCAVFSGQAGTAMDWDDGKEFGELRWRSRKGIFAKAVYPIDHVEQIKALRSFLTGIGPDDILGPQAVPTPRCEPSGDLRAFALFTSRKPYVALGWLFSKGDEGQFRLVGLHPGSYQITWYDPWTGKPLPDEKPSIVATNEKGSLAFDSRPVLERLRRTTAAFPRESRLAKGKDLAFKVEPAEN